MFLIIAESIILASSCSIDAFVVSFAYGSKRIKIPLLSNQIINLICGLMLGVSLCIGSLLRNALPAGLTTAVSFTILFVIGVTKLLDSVTKTFIRNKLNSENWKKKIEFSLLNFKFILNLYINPEAADVDTNKIISPGEAAALAVSLSLDGIAVGFGAAIGDVNILAVLILAFITNVIAVTSGCFLGNRFAGKLPFNISWLSGFILIGLAITKLFA